MPMCACAPVLHAIMIPCAPHTSLCRCAPGCHMRVPTAPCMPSARSCRHCLHAKRQEAVPSCLMYHHAPGQREEDDGRPRDAEERHAVHADADRERDVGDLPRLRRAVPPQPGNRAVCQKYGHRGDTEVSCACSVVSQSQRASDPLIFSGCVLSFKPWCPMRES
jgi:hypothetical protein